MAPRAPAEVVTVILDVPDAGNPRVYDAFVEAGTAMRVEQAALLAPSVARWLREASHLLLMPGHAATLARQLAEGAKGDEAQLIASALLIIDPADEAAEYSRPSRRARR